MIALIVARPGALRAGLSGLLSAMPEIAVVSAAGDLDGALKYVMQHCPSLALFGLEELDDVHLAKVESMKDACPQMKTIVLVERIKADAALETSGIDAVLMQGVRASRVTETISTLLEPNNAQQELH